MPEFNHSKASKKDRPIDERDRRQESERVKSAGAEGVEGQRRSQNSVSAADAWNFSESPQNEGEPSNPE